jgi:plasmid maintenance system killer protein
MAGQWSMRVGASWLLAISCFAAGMPAVAQEAFSAAEICRNLKSVFAAVDKSDLRSLKGKRLDETKWQAAKNFPGMSECVVEDPPETKDLETFLLQESGLMCEVSIDVKRPDLTGVTDIEKVKAANRTAAIAAREEAIKLF